MGRLAIEILAVVLAGGLIFVVLGCYGIVDELLQIPVGRTCEVNDWFADLGGIVVGLILVAGAAVTIRARRKRLPREPNLAE